MKKLCILLSFILINFPFSYNIKAIVSEFIINTTTDINNALLTIENNDNYENILIFTSDNIDVNGFAGMSGKHIVLKSSNDNVFNILNVGQSLKGNITFDNVRCFNEYSQIFANGFLFETTSNFSGSLRYDGQPSVIGSLFGGSYNTNINSQTNLILNGGSFSIVYGGGKDGNVEGNTNIILDGINVNVTTLFGGGLASNSSSSLHPVGLVRGSTNIQMRSGKVGYLFGGGDNQSDAQNNTTREPARVFQDTNVIVGKEGALARTAVVGSTMQSSAGSRHSTVMNTNFTFLQGSVNYGVDANGNYASGGAFTSGCGENDDVLGVVRMYVNKGSLIGKVSGGGDQGDYGSGGSTIKNINGDPNAIYIFYDDGIIENPATWNTTHGVNIGGQDSYQDTILGNVRMDVYSGDLDFAVLDNENKDNCSYSGMGQIYVYGGRIAQIQGYSKDFNRSQLIYESCGTKENPQQSGYVYRMSYITLKNNANVEIDSDHFAQFGSVQTPLYSTPIVEIKEGSILTTRNSNTQSKYVLADNGTWHVKGKLWVHENIKSKQSTFIFDQSFEAGFKHRDDDNLSQFVAFESNHDKIINWTEEAVGLITGNLISTNSDYALKGSLNIAGNYEGQDDLFRLPAIQEGENYPNESIPINIDGKSTGTNGVLTVSISDYTIAQTPIVGDNYITGNKADKASDEIFLLKNQEALAEELYLKRVHDVEVEDNSYYMWQVARRRTVTFDSNGADTEPNPKIVQIEISDDHNKYTVDKWPLPPTRKNYQFLGWNMKQDGTGEEFTEKTIVKKNLTVYAQWKALENTSPIKDGNATPQNTKDSSQIIFYKILFVSSLIIIGGYKIWKKSEPQK